MENKVTLTKKYIYIYIDNNRKPSKGIKGWNLPGHTWIEAQNRFPIVTIAINTHPIRMYSSFFCNFLFFMKVKTNLRKVLSFFIINYVHNWLKYIVGPWSLFIERYWSLKFEMRTIGPLSLKKECYWSFHPIPLIYLPMWLIKRWFVIFNIMWHNKF